MRKLVRIGLVVASIAGTTAGLVAGVSYAATGDAPDKTDAQGARRSVCTGLQPGSYVPTPATTGVLPGSNLKRVNGELTITSPGTYANLDIHGFVNVRAANVTIVNSIVRGGKNAVSSRGLINAVHPAVSNLVVEGVKLQPEYPSRSLTGILGHDYTAKCVDVYQTVDGFGVFNTHKPGAPTNVTIQQSFCHELAYFSPEPNQKDNKTHNDCVQIQGGSGTIVRDNWLHAGLSSKAGTLNYPHPQAMSTIMLNDNVGKTTRVQVYGNRLTAGEVSVNGRGLKHSSGDHLGTIHDNKFDRGQYFSGHTIDLSTSVRADVYNNHYLDGEPITVHRI